jgi:hypothetical protein
MEAHILDQRSNEEDQEQKELLGTNQHLAGASHQMIRFSYLLSSPAPLKCNRVTTFF